ncbi:MAG: hypothetical protein HY717_06285 [Planctomycetes bacterium]|nr:hypothetical protein [Planctomycetota bacterium]
MQPSPTSPPPSRGRRYDLLTATFLFIFSGQWLVLSPPGHGDEPDKKNELDKAPAEEKPPACLRCEGKGRIICPMCQGKGDLFKPCDRCGGTGWRRCPSCEPYRDQFGGPGRKPCPACGGEGHADFNPEKPCYRCRGSGWQSCGNCAGRGELRCEKEELDRTCPLCRYVGKINCPACNRSPMDEANTLLKSLEGEAAPEKHEKAEKAEKGATFVEVALKEKEAGAKGEGPVKAVLEVKTPSLAAGTAKVVPEKSGERDLWLKQLEDLKVGWPKIAQNYEEMQQILASRNVKEECSEIVREIDRLKTLPEGSKAPEPLTRIKKSAQTLSRSWDDLLISFEEVGSKLKTASPHVEGLMKESAPLENATAEDLKDLLRTPRYHADLTQMALNRVIQAEPAKHLAALDGLKNELFEVKASFLALPSPNGEAGKPAARGATQPERENEDRIPPGREEAEENTAANQRDSGWLKTIALILALIGLIVPAVAFYHLRKTGTLPEAVQAPLVKRRLPRPPVRRVV